MFKGFAKQRAKVAGIDIGTNTVRLIVKELPGKKTLIRETKITRLGRGVDSTGELDSTSVEVTLSVLQEYRRTMSELGVEDFAIVATSATRDASNSVSFLERVRGLFGKKVRVLSGEEEGRLAYIGAVSGLPEDFGPGERLVVDIGGGSTELIWGGESPAGARSLNIGAVRLTEKFLHSDPPQKKELQDSEDYIREQLRTGVPFIQDIPHRLISVAGTPTTIVAMKLELEKYEPARVHGYWLTLEDVELMLRKMAFLTNLGRLHVKGLEPARADVIVAGIQILLEVMRIFGAAKTMVSEYDLLDGIIETVNG